MVLVYIYYSNYKTKKKNTNIYNILNLIVCTNKHFLFVDFRIFIIGMETFRNYTQRIK